MRDPRHPKQYPKGDPLMVTPEWKQLVRKRVAENKREGKPPTSVKALAAMLKADAAGLYLMLKGKQRTSKYAPKICDLLGIEPAMVTNPAVTEAVGDDDFDRTVERMRRLSPSRRKSALALVQTHLDALDSE